MTKELQKLILDAGKKLERLDFGEAIGLYQKVLKQSPGNAAASLGLAMAYNRTGKSADAMALLQPLWVATQSAAGSVQKATQAEIMAQVGLAFLQMGNPEQALGAYRIALGLQRSKAIEQQIATLSAMLRGASPLEQLMRHANTQLASGKIPEAVQSLKAALTLAPDNDVVLHALGDALRMAGDFSGAMTCIQQAIVMQPEVAQYHNTLGMLFQNRGEFEQAVKFHQRALKLDPKFAPAMCNLGIALRHLGELPQALKAYEAALKIDPNLVQAYNNLGNVLRDLGKISEARLAYKKAIALAPNYRDAVNNLAAMGDGAGPKKAAAKGKKSAPGGKPKADSQAVKSQSAKTKPVSAKSNGAKKPSKAAKKAPAKTKKRSR